MVKLANEGAAMTQLRSRGYADKYRHLDQPIHLITVKFSRETRNVATFETVRVWRPAEGCRDADLSPSRRRRTRSPPAGQR